MRAFNLLLRGATLASRFLLVVFIAKFLSSEELGTYSLLAASISYALFIVGLDFYTYSSREILAVDKSHWYKMVKNQFLFYLFFYAVSFPLIYFVLSFGFIPQGFVFWFFALLVVEHLSQESMRLLVVLNKSLLANISLFIRTGIWVYLCIAVMFYSEQHRHLESILILWWIGACCSISLVIPEILKLKRASTADSCLDLKWLIAGIKVAIPLLAGTLALRSIFIVDRYSLSYFSSLSSVGVYSFYASFANALLAFVDAVIIMQFYPKMVSAAKENNTELFSSYSRQFLRSLMLLSLILCVGLPVLVYIILLWLGKGEYLEYFPLIGVMLLTSVVYSLSLIPHYKLYSYGHDGKIVVSSVITAVLGGVTMPLGAYFYGVYGVAAGQMLAVVGLLLLKLSFARRAI